MRLFVAIEIGPEIARRLAAFSEELKRRTSEMAPGARVTWIPIERLHLTLRFIGEADERLATAVAAALEPPIAIAPFALTAAGAGSFPKSGAPRVIWAGVVGEGGALVELEREVGTRLAGCGILREDRPYQPHLTLARVRDAAELRAERLLEGMSTAGFGRTTVDAITLFHSRLSPRGPSYVPLRRTPLGSG